MDSSFHIGIDLGGTQIRTCLIDNTGSIIAKRSTLTNPERGFNLVIQDILTHTQDLIQLNYGPIRSIGIGVPGQVNSRQGTIDFAPNLNWMNVPLKQILYSELHIPIAVTNDVRAATFGEWFFGAGRSCNNIVSCFIGTGIGGGIIANGEMLEGETFCAGEIGHMIIQADGPICNCGQKGCFEALASGWAIAKMAQELIVKNPLQGNHLLRLANNQLEKVDAKIVVQAFRDADPIATEIVKNVFSSLTVGCINLVNIFNPERLILGGGVFFGLPEALVHIQNGVFKYALKSATRVVDILPAQLGNEAGLVGAAVYGKKQLSLEGLECTF